MHSIGQRIIIIINAAAVATTTTNTTTIRLIATVLLTWVKDSSAIILVDKNSYELFVIGKIRLSTQSHKQLMSYDSRH